MNAIEIRNLTKSFKGMYALNGVNMTVPVGAIYGFIGENGSGKSTTMKVICGHLVPDSGEITLFGKSGDDAGVRSKVGALIENAGCFPNSSIYDNLMMQAINLGIPNKEEDIIRVLKIVRMEQNSKLKFKECSLGMKQRVGIAMSLLGNPALLILDEPINGLDADGMKIMREILLDITQNLGCTVLISSHILGELEKIATHYGIIRQGRIITEISAKEMDSRFENYIHVTTLNLDNSYKILSSKFKNVKKAEDHIKVFDEVEPEDILKLLLENNEKITELGKNKIGLLEYYESLMSAKDGE